jgi:hypothetical protein
VLILGMCFIQVANVYARIVTSELGSDYAALANWIDLASRDPLAKPTNIEILFEATYLQSYFDPVVPILNKLVHLTDDPFRLLGFQSVAMLGGSIAVWVIAITNDRIRLLAGTYLFWTNRNRTAFALLLIGTLTKISFWPSWLMFGVVHALKHRWRWAVLYAVVGCAAIALHSMLQTPGEATPVILFFPQLGTTPGEVVVNAILKPQLWLSQIANPMRWEFFLLLLLPLGFTNLRRLDALAPAFWMLPGREQSSPTSTRLSTSAFAWRPFSWVCVSPRGLCAG